MRVGQWLRLSAPTNRLLANLGDGFFGLRDGDVAELVIGCGRPIPSKPLAGSLAPAASFGNKYRIQPL